MWWLPRGFPPTHDTGDGVICSYIYYGGVFMSSSTQVYIYSNNSHVFFFFCSIVKVNNVIIYILILLFNNSRCPSCVSTDEWIIFVWLTILTKVYIWTKAYIPCILTVILGIIFVEKWYTQATIISSKQFETHLPILRKLTSPPYLSNGISEDTDTALWIQTATIPSSLCSREDKHTIYSGKGIFYVT